MNAPQDVITCRDPANAENFAATANSKLPLCIPMNEAEFAALSSMYVVGGFVGAIAAGPISTKHGRLLAMRLTSIFFILGAVLEALSASVLVLSTGRFIAGIGAGASTVIVPLYVSEISPPHERGLFGTMTQVMINLGILITQTLGYFLSRGSLWRIILASGAALGVIQFLGLILVPESPTWLAAHKDPHLAMQTLQRIRGPNFNISDEVSTWDVDTKVLRSSSESERLLPTMLILRRSDSASSTKSSNSLAHVGFIGVIRDPLYRPAIIAVTGIMFAQQFCGINSIMMYSVSLLEGTLPMSSSAVTIGLAAMNVITTILCAPLADKIGRKGCLLLSIAGMGSMAVCLAISLRLQVKIFSAISVLFYVAFFATGLGPVPFMMASELVGQEAVGSTQSWCLAANYVATFIVAQFFPLVNSFLNGRFGGRGWAYFGFGGLALLSFLFVSFWVPETKGKKDPDEVWGRDRRMD